MNVDDLASRKTQLRKSLNSWRSQFAVHLADHDAERLALQERFARELIALSKKLQAKRIASYMPFGGEPDVSLFNKYCLDARLELLLPVSNPDNTLHWVEFDGVTTKTSIFGFAEPHGPAVSLAPVDLIVVPALAIDHSGNRLGKGKGFYDRALAEIEAPLVAVVYEHELLDSLPAQPHDHPVNFAVTQSQTLRLLGS